MSCCNKSVPKFYSYCPHCGKLISDKTEYCDVSYDSWATGWLCAECGSGNQFECKFCGIYGVKRCGSFDKEVIMVYKRSGYVWGMISVITSSCSITSPFLGVIIGSMAEFSWFLEPFFQILFLFLPPIGFVFAFIGKVRCEYGTEARKLCNIGAGIGIVMSAILIWSLSVVFLQDFFSVSEQAAAITGLIDMVLITGYFLIAYIRGKVLWFI